MHVYVYIHIKVTLYDAVPHPSHPHPHPVSRHCAPLTDPQVQPSPTAMPFSCCRRGEESMSRANMGTSALSPEMSRESVGKSKGTFQELIAIKN